jgi:hypothetical protein
MSKRTCAGALRHLLAAICIAVPAAAAALTTTGFTMTADGDGPYTGRSYAGSFSYDAGVLTGLGEEVLDVGFGALQIAFQFEGQSFVELNDVDHDEYPQLTFFDGIPVSLNYKLVRGVNGVDFTDSSVAEVVVIGDLYLVPGSDALALNGLVVLVPEPSVAAMLALGLPLLLVLRRRSRRG